MDSWKEAYKLAREKLDADPDYPRRKYIKNWTGLLIILFTVLFIPFAELVTHFFNIPELITCNVALVFILCLGYTIPEKMANKKFGYKK